VPGTELCSSCSSQNMASWRSRSLPVPCGLLYERLPPCRGSRIPSGPVWPVLAWERRGGSWRRRDERAVATPAVVPLQVDVDSREVLGSYVSSTLRPTRAGSTHRVALRGLSRAGHPSRHRPPEGLSKLFGRPGGGDGPLEAVDRRLVGLRVYARWPPARPRRRDRSFSSSSEEMP